MASPVGSIPYTRGSYFLVPKKYTVNKKIAVRGVVEANKTEVSHRSFKPQKHFFQVPPKEIVYDREYQRASRNFYELETKLIWRAFDKPELIGMLLHDETIQGHTCMYDKEFLEAAEHWTLESRYWRCIGISKPFLDKNTLRAHAWEDNNTQTGTLRLSQAMRHALMDLERAVKRKELGLSPNYVWDQWGPSGFIDGRRADSLPRFVHNPYVDPDGVDITELDVAPFNTHEQIRERYWEWIAPTTAPFEDVFLSIGHGALLLEDLGNEQIQSLYKKLNPNAVSGQRAGSTAIGPDDMRTLLFLVADPMLLNQLGTVDTWQDVQEAVASLRNADQTDLKIDAARLLHNTRDETVRVRRFFEEKCGFVDFMNTPDKDITGAVLCYLKSLRKITEDNEWGRPLAQCLSDLERFKILGSTAYKVYRVTEDLILDKRRRTWATRFAGEANEEAALDYLLENFGQRSQRHRSTGATGSEFDREQEPIGRHVQRRVLDSDLQTSTLALARKSKGRLFLRKKDVLSSLHERQVQDASRGVR